MKLEISDGPILDQRADTIILPVMDGNQLDDAGRTVDDALVGGTGACPVQRHGRIRHSLVTLLEQRGKA